MKTNELAVKVFIFFVLIFSLQTSIWFKPSLNNKSENVLIFFVVIDLCCSFKIERLSQGLAVSVTIGT